MLGYYRHTRFYATVLPHIIHAVVFHLRRTASTFICIDHVATCSASRLFPLSCRTVSRQLQQPSSPGPLTPFHPLLPSTSIRLPCLHPSPPTIWLCCSPIIDLIMFYAPVSCCSRCSPVSYWLGSCTHILLLRFRTRIPSFGLHAHNFFEFMYPCPSSLAYALVFLSLGLRTYILLPWVTHPCLLWVTHPYCFVDFLCTPAHLYVPFSYSPIWLGIPIPWDYGTSWTLQVFSTPTISIGSMLYLMCYSLSCIGYPHSLKLSSP